MIPIGFTLQPDGEFLERCDGILREEVDYFEVAPETTWFEDGAGVLRENGYHRRFLELGEATGCFFVAHGVGLSMGTAARSDEKRRWRWTKRLAADQARFRYRWYTDHLGATSLDGWAVTLPMPLPMTTRAAAVVRRRLATMRRVVGDVGVENNVAYFLLGAPLDEPGFLASILRAPGSHLLLDLHNLYTMAVNFGFAPDDYLARLDLARVIEIHLSGGSSSDGAWLPSGRVMRLDSHDAAIPEEVWKLFERVAPRCPRLQGVTVERMEGTVGAGDVAPLREEVRRARATVKGLG